MAVRGECRNSFGLLGLLKVHWECWSDCNLPCEFCYRTRGNVLSTADAKKLISAVQTAGVQTLVFAGGDPSIRPDIAELISLAREIGLRVEVQTNAHHAPANFLRELRYVQLAGLSLDGPIAAVHDAFRGKRGNFDRVLGLLGKLNEWGVPVIVRTIVSKPNYETVHLIGRLLQNMDNLVRWSLIEFSPVGEGYTNCNNYQINRALFRAAAERACSAFPDDSKIDIYELEAKAGAYALVTPAGFLYGTGTSTINGVYPTIGSILQEHLSILADKLPFSKERHVRRYG
jgi:MoaA/NifB/PqqE/SkfB family radical SAM enzyme